MADENPIETMTPGQVLADASVADFIKSMGLSIAEAQKALDLNSIAQIGEYTKSQGAPTNKSLIEMGLSPPFYHYQHADLSVSLQLMMKVGTTKATNVGVKVDGSIGKGGSGSAEARTAQVTLKAIPASVTVDGTKNDATGADLDAAAEALAAKLRAPAGKFEQAFVSAKHNAPKAELDPGTAKNPVLTPGAVAFLSSDPSSTGIIRITASPTAGQKETFVLANNKSTEVQSEADTVVYARKVVTQINQIGGFKARLARDSSGDADALDAPGTVWIALFATGSSKLTDIAMDELGLLANALIASGRTVEITGFADTQGEKADNVRLGTARATVVRDYLIAQKVPASQFAELKSRGEDRWKGTKDPKDNAQFRRAEMVFQGSTDLFIVVDGDGTQLQAKPTPDKTQGDPGNGFIVAKNTAGLPVTGKNLKLGDAGTPVAIKGDAVATDGETFAQDTPEAFAFNLVKAINADSATHKARATRRGSVVMLSSADDLVTIDLVTLSTADIKLSADGGAEITKPLKAITPASGDTGGSTKYALAVGVAVDVRSSRQFEQSINGNSAINARLVAVPAPVEFLDEIRKYLGPDVRVTPDPQPVQTPTPTPAPANP